jgi:catalase
MIEDNPIRPDRPACPNSFNDPVSVDEHRAEGTLFDNIDAAMDGVPIEIVKRHLMHFYRADPDYGIGVATRMGLSVSDLPAVSAAAAE